MKDRTKPNVLFHFLHRAHHRRVSEEWNARGVGDVGAPMLVVTLYNNEQAGRTLSQRELARILRLSPATVAVSLKNLEGKGYVVRTADAGDQRRNLVGLTDKGRRAVELGTEAFQAVEEQMLSGFSPEEKEQLTSFFLRMLENLGVKEGDVPPPPPGGPFGGPPPHGHGRRGCGRKECDRP